MTASCHFRRQLQYSLVSVLYSLFTSIISIEMTCDLHLGQMWKQSDRLYYLCILGEHRGSSYCLFFLYFYGFYSLLVIEIEGYGKM